MMADPKASKKTATETKGKAAPGKAVEAESEDKKKPGLKGFLAARTPREQLILKVAALVMICVLIDLIVVRPVGRHLERLTERIQAKEAMIPKRLLILKYRDKVMQQYDSLKNMVSTQDLSPESEISKFLSQIERASKDTNLFISNIDPVQINKDLKEGYLMTVDITGTGSMDFIHLFMRNLESKNAPIRIRSFTLRPKNKAADEIIYSFSIEKLIVRQGGTE